MLGMMEEILCELGGGGGAVSRVHENHRQGLPPGFRFHPTDEELISFYLASKVLNGRFCGVNIAEVDLNKCEPWELPDAAKMGEKEWYFFSLRDRKYPTGMRTNRATCAGYWKATGKDREVYGGGGGGGSDEGSGVLVGMKKTLVFYKGRAPRGEKTKWVMHEYRLDVDFFHRHSCKEEWVICRILHKVGEKKPNNMLIQGQIRDHHHHHLNLIGGCSTSSAGGAGGCGGGRGDGDGGFFLPPLLESPAPTTTTTLVESHQQNGGILMASFQKSPFLIHHNSNHNNQQKVVVVEDEGEKEQKQEQEQESYLQQIKSLINPVFSHLIIPPPLNASSTAACSSHSPPLPPPSLPPTTTTTSNLWTDFMGFPFVTDIIVRDHEIPQVSTSSPSFGFSRAAGFQINAFN